MPGPTVTLLPYDEDWPRRFAAESAVLERLLAPWLSAGPGSAVEHIGSTAVPGLAAKPVVDMLAGVADLKRARAAVPVLLAAGYGSAPHRPAEAHWLFRPATGPVQDHTVHLHLTEPGSALWRERLAFRDALRADPALREEYAQLKQALAGRPGSGLAAYAADKRGFVRRVLAGAGVELA